MDEKKLCALDGRLSCAAGFVRQDSVVADIGTDHGYIPVYLLQRGISKFVIASDINKAPLDKAVENARKYGVSHLMEFVLADGIDEAEAERHNVTDIVICGMGGELIAEILKASEYTRKSGVRLILQPMSYPERLRKYLAECGYAILDEKLCHAAGKTYSCILAEYDGEVRSFSPVQYILGEHNICRRGDLFEKFAKDHISKLEEKIAGMKKGGLDTSEYEGYCREIEQIIEKTGGVQ